MKTHPSTRLTRYLAQAQPGTQPGSPTEYIVRGGARLGLADLDVLRKLLPQVGRKADRLTDSVRLRRRLDVLALFLQESEGRALTPLVRECAFVLYYFLKGYDFIPDSIPDVGLVDDALLVETACNRNLLALRTHWDAHRRIWPENI